MAQWNHREKTLSAKLVYYGPAYGGKTTNLESLHRRTDPRGEQRLTSLKTAGDRTLFFDLLPIDVGKIAGFTQIDEQRANVEAVGFSAANGSFMPIGVDACWRERTSVFHDRQFDSRELQVNQQVHRLVQRHVG